MRYLYRFLLVALFLGGLNTGILGLFQINTAAYLLGSGTTALKAFYLAVGTGALAFGWALLRIR